MLSTAAATITKKDIPMRKGKKCRRYFTMTLAYNHNNNMFFQPTAAVGNNSSVGVLGIVVCFWIW